VGLRRKYLVVGFIFLVNLGLIRPGLPLSLKLVKQVRHWSNPQYSRIVIDVEGEVHYKYKQLENPARVYVDIYGTATNPTLKGIPIPVEDGLLRKVRMGQNKPDRVRVVLDLAAINDFKVFTLYEPFRIVIDVFGDSKKRSVTKGIKTVRKELPPHKYKPFHSGIKKIVIDPGHGGKDPGAIGSGGVREKDLTLDIARRLVGLLKRKGAYQILLTRDRDIYIPLEERTAIANRERADLFISIHINASERPGLKGIETYFLNFTSDPDSMALVARENLIPQERLNDLQIILQDLMLTSKINESSALAGSIQSSLIRQLKGDYDGVVDLGVKRGPFYVLFGAQMPSILVETLFLTNDQDRERILSTNYREGIAQALLAGIENYSRIGHP